MSFQGTRTRRGSVDIDRSAVLRGTVLQTVLALPTIPIGIYVDIPPGYLLLPTTIVAGGYVGLRSGNWGDEYMDGAAMGLVGGVLSAILVSLAAAGILALVTDQVLVQVFLSSMLALGGIVLVMVPMMGIFGAISAWFVAKKYGRKLP